MNQSSYNIQHLAELLQDHFSWNRARIKCIIFLIVGMLQMRTVNLAKIAITFPGKAKLGSNYKRLQRLLGQFSIDLDRVAEFIARLVPISQFKLTLDRTNWKYGDSNINYLVLAIVYCGSSTPLLWVALSKRGNSNTKERIDLMNRFIALFGTQTIGCLFADREFIGIQWFKYLIDKKINFIIRIKKNTLVSNSRGALVSAENLFRNLPRGAFLVLSGKRTVWGQPLYVIGLKMLNGDFVIIATPDQPETALENYKQRWSIETLFCCLKSRGFDMESTHITDPKRLEKLFVFLAITFTWAQVIGEWQYEVKPIKLKNHGRPAQSLFRLGLDYLRTCLFHHQEPDRQAALHQALDRLFKRFGWRPQNCPWLPPTNPPPGQNLALSSLG